MRIILSDHHVQPRLALKMLLDEQPEFNVIGEAADAQELLLLAENHPADLIIVDGELPGCYIEELITKLHGLHPKPIVIVMSTENVNSRKLLNAGADAFVSKANTPDWLLDVLWKYESRIKKEK
jgi:DNA-binding NarL/FixJ family response regulator